MGTIGQDGGCQGPPGARSGTSGPAQPPRVCPYTIQAARGAQGVQHLLTPLGEAILGPGNAL